MKTEFKTRVINVDQFSKIPCCGYVLQLLILANDVDSLVELNRSRKNPSGEERNVHTNLWSKGSLVYLQRQNISIVFECLDTTIARISKLVNGTQPKTKVGPSKKPRLLWDLIREEKQLYDQLAALESFRLDASYKVMDAVRDKLGAHADIDALKNGLKKAIESDRNNFGLVSLANNGQFRATFVDDVLVQQNIELANNAGISPNDFAELFGTVREKLVRFSHDMLVAFCKENELFASTEEAQTVQKELVNLKDFKFLPPVIRD